MKILMTGIKDVDISVREKFSLTKEKLSEVLKVYHCLDGISGVVIISTCNRCEVYVSQNEHFDYNLAEILCHALNQDYAAHKDYFFDNADTHALNYLCMVGAGVYSQILGDDQIITQVRCALEFSRDNSYSDSFLETFFRTAICAAKEIKTKIVLRDTKCNSAPHKAIEKLKDICNLSQQNALVIGNGQMGRLIAELLIKEHADVTVTLREYKKGVVQVPTGVATIPYSRRYEAFERSTILVSATTSPHHTIHYNDCINLNAMPQIIVDLAVPRDIDPKIKGLDVKLFTVDDLGDKDIGLSAEKNILAGKIIDKHTQRYSKWLSYKRKVVNA